MSDPAEIKKQIAKTSDRTKVFGLLKKMPPKLTQVEFRYPSVKGEFWIEKGTRIFYAKSDADGDNGTMVMMNLLAASKLSFGVMPTPVEKPRRNVEVDVMLDELVADEAMVIRALKDNLWPVNDAAKEPEVETPAVTQTPIEASIQPEPIAEPTPAPPAWKPPPELVIQETPPGVPLSEADLLFADFAPAEPEHATASNASETSFGSLLDDDAAQIPRGISDEDLDQLDAAFKPDPRHASNEGFNPEETTDLASLSAIDPHEEMTLEMLVMQGEVDDEETVGFAPPIEARGQIRREGVPLQENKMSDDLEAWRREEMKALEPWVSEKPENFFETRETPLYEDDVFAQRRIEMQELNALLNPHSELLKDMFLDVEPVRPDKDKEKREREFDQLKEYFAENPQRFFEYVNMGEIDPGGSEELRRKILELMAGQRDVEAFEKRENLVDDDSAVKMVWTPEMDAPPPAPPVEEPYSITKEAPENYVPGGTDTAFDNASALSQKQSQRNKLEVAQQAGDDMSLISRDPNPNNRFGFIDRKQLKREKIPKHVVVAAALGAVMIPLVVLYVHHNINMNAEADYEDQRAASELAARAANEESQAAKPKQAYRTAEAAGPVNSTPPNAHAEGTNGAAGISQSEIDSYKWVPPSNPQAPPSRDQADKAARALSQGDGLMAMGRVQEAAQIFAGGLLESPNNAPLRIRAARAYMQLRQYDIAKDILLSGMHGATSQAEFQNYVAILNEFPRL